MADYAGASSAIIDAIRIKAALLQDGGYQPQVAAPLLLQLAEAYAAVREASVGEEPAVRNLPPRVGVTPTP